MHNKHYLIADTWELRPKNLSQYKAGDARTF